MDYYQILHVSERASQEEIRKAYRKLAVKYHPDNAGEQAREQFDKVQEAYGVLGDEEKRAAYDVRRRGDTAGNGPETKEGRESKAGQPGGQEAAYKDMAAFYAGAYQISFEQFFKKGMQKQAKQESGARPMNTDALFESYFKCN